ncbi:YY1-associated factor 2 isoform X3 [Ahaetulla prasina]|uniref:YY1-associated factor 2 isoform X3 n=1 Tax=Ahaetulla prasina TaxID=499056 RepID=UPI00264983B8|nr:YY1-associated factor 2 isoform X3 [Ahaetulla prasina]
MGDKKSPTRPKRQPKPSSDEGYWDCSVCTFRNSAEAFKCMMCDVRKGTSTRYVLAETGVGRWRKEAWLRETDSSFSTGNRRFNPFLATPGTTQRKGVSRKPRSVSQLVAQQVTQQFVSPTQSKKEKKDKVEKEKSEKETTTKKNSHKKTRFHDPVTAVLKKVTSGWF